MMPSVMDCVKARDLPQLLGALAQGGHVDARDEEGWTALGRASADGFAAGVGALQDAGADLEAIDSEGETVLAWAACWAGCRASSCCWRAERKAIAGIFFGNTPALHAVGASAEGFEMTLNCLVDAGADLDVLNENGESVALIAAKGSLLEGEKSYEAEDFESAEESGSKELDGPLAGYIKSKELSESRITSKRGKSMASQSDMLEDKGVGPVGDENTSGAKKALAVCVGELGIIGKRAGKGPSYGRKKNGLGKRID